MEDMIQFKNCCATMVGTTTAFLRFEGRVSLLTLKYSHRNILISLDTFRRLATLWWTASFFLST